jgi:hypothetical protein
MRIFLSILGVVVAAFIGIYCWLWGAQTGHGLTLFWVAGWPLILTLLAIPVFAVLGGMLLHTHSEAKYNLSTYGSARGYYSGYGTSHTRKKEEPEAKKQSVPLLPLGILGLVLAVLSLVAFILMCFQLPYAAGHKYASTVKTTTSQVPTYQQRTPFQVAEQSSNRNLQNITGDAQNTKSLPANGKNGEWDTLVIRRGVFQGYEATQSIETPLYGTVSENEVTICKFNPNAQLRLGGAMPHNNLNRAIDAATAPNVTWDGNDAYSYCADGTPIVVVPLKQLSGFYGAPWSYYGDAVYNGKTGALQILTDKASISKLQGSTYPLSLASDVRNAYQASGAFWDWFQDRTGYDTTDSDQDDPNGGNVGEFNLRQENGGATDYVTPLLPRGSSSSVVALGVTPSRDVTPGTRASLQVYKYAKTQIRQAPSTAEQQIKTSYSHMADWASGLQVFEIVPAGKGLWVASLGFKQSVDYRAYVTDKGDVTLYNKDGQKLDSAGNPVTAAPTTGGSTGGTVTTPVKNGEVDLSKLSNKQLQDLGQRILKELADRSGK